MSLATILMIFFGGLFLSAFFSGSETGFYRVNRFRLLFEARTGDRISASMLWLSNRPTLYVGATLVGNNLANYLTSFAIVAAVSQSPLASRAGELAATIVLSPVVFVYGELLPKSLFVRAPNRLIRLAGPLMLISVVLFAPAASLLWAVGWILQRFIGDQPLRIQQSVARHELQEMFREGHAAGLLKGSQQRLSRNLFSIASRAVSGFCAPAHRLMEAKLGEPVGPLLRSLEKRSLTAAPVRDPQNPKTWAGYVRTVDLVLQKSTSVDEVRPLPEVLDRDTHLHALMLLQERDEEMAQVVNERGESIGVVFVEDLMAPLFRRTVHLG